MAAVESWQRALAEPSRARVLEQLEAAPDGLEVTELAQRLALHANTVRWHLGVLADVGLVAATPRRHAGPGRPPTAYVALERPAAADDHRLLATVLAAVVAATESGAARAEAAGREYGRFLVERPAPFARLDAEEAVAKLTTLLDENGFAPERDDDRARVHMHRCPFRELAEQHGSVICGLHLGLVRGALDELRAPVQVETLEPFDTPGRCTAYLRSS